MSFNTFYTLSVPVLSQSNHFLLFLFTVTTAPTPVSEITTLSLQSNTNVPASSSHPVTSSSLSADIDATTISAQPRPDESLKVLPLGATANGTASDKEDVSTTVTSSTPSSMTVNSSDTKIKPEIVRNGGAIEQFVSNDSDNQANQPQTELVAGDEMDEMSRLKQEKEGRAINFPLGVGSNNQNSTMPAHMQGTVNFVTPSTEKTHVMSFFDLSDVSMDHDDGSNEHREVKKDMKTTTAVPGPIINDNCSFNGTDYKVSFKLLHLINFLASTLMSFGQELLRRRLEAPRVELEN